MTARGPYQVLEVGQVNRHAVNPVEDLLFAVAAEMSMRKGLRVQVPLPSRQAVSAVKTVNRKRLRAVMAEMSARRGQRMVYEVPLPKGPTTYLEVTPELQQRMAAQGMSPTKIPRMTDNALRPPPSATLYAGIRPEPVFY